MSFQVYADESGGKGQGGYAVMVGVLADAVDWIHFSEDWARVLAIEPAVSAFHMYEAMHHLGEFRRWSSEERDSRINKLIDVVNHFDLRGVLVSVDLDAHKEIVDAYFRDSLGEVIKSERKISKAATDPYFHLFQFTILGAARYLYDRGFRERFEMIFDESRIIGLRVRQWWPAIREMAPPRLSSLLPPDPLFHDDKRAIPLQLADIVAASTRLRAVDDYRFDWIVSAMDGLKWTKEQLVLDRAALEKIYSPRDQSQELRPEVIDYIHRLVVDGNPPDGMSLEWRMTDGPNP